MDLRHAAMDSFRWPHGRGRPCAVRAKERHALRASSRYAKGHRNIFGRRGFAGLRCGGPPGERRQMPLHPQGRWLENTPEPATFASTRPCVRADLTRQDPDENITPRYKVFFSICLTP